MTRPRGPAVAGNGGRRAEDRLLLVALRALGLGDFLTAVPAYRALADAFPGHRRLLAAPVALAPLVGLTGALDGLVPATPLSPLPPRLGRPDVAVNLHGRGPQSHHTLIVTRPRRLLAFSHPDVPESSAGPPWIDEEHEVERWCRLLDSHGVPADPRNLDLRTPTLPVPSRAPGATIVHPGAASPARRWPPERFAAVARAEADAGRRVVVTAGPGEGRLAHRVVHLAGRKQVSPVAAPTRPGTVGITVPGDLGHFAALVGAAGRVVCGDTGVAHLATALGTPSVVLFGPSSPARWGPPPDRPAHRVLWAGLTGPADGPNPHEGLLAISVADVLSALSALPDRKMAPR